jgi:CheY-like chemotaxis protein
MKVLFVDDEQVLMKPFTEALERKGWQVLKASTISEALEFASENYCLLILDIMLPIDLCYPFADVDWKGLPVCSTNCGVAFYNYLQRQGLLHGRPTLIFTTVSHETVKEHFNADGCVIKFSNKEIFAHDFLSLVENTCIGFEINAGIE